MSNYLVWALVSPVTWIFWTLLLFALLVWSDRRRLAGWVLTLGGLASYAIATHAVASLLIAPLETRETGPLPERIDGIVLLGGAELPGLWTEHRGLQLSAAGDRYTRALELAQRHRSARLLLVSGPESRKPSEADVAGPFLKLMAQRRLRIVNDTADTCDNARGVRSSGQVRRPDHWLLVTSAAHMPRALACFRAHGLPLVPAPADFRSLPADMPLGLTQLIPSVGGLDASTFALHEWLGLMHYRLTGRFDPTDGTIRSGPSS